MAEETIEWNKAEQELAYRLAVADVDRLEKQVASARQAVEEAAQVWVDARVLLYHAKQKLARLSVTANQ